MLQWDALDEQIGRTNAILTEQLAHHVRHRLRGRTYQVHTIDNLLRNGQGDRAILLQDRSQLISVINRYQIALAPHKRLPLELLQIVFVYVLEAYTLSAPNTLKPPLLLCRVCSAWRWIALNMPELWNSLHYFEEGSTTRLQKVQGAQMWFSHAGNLPLSLTLTDTEESAGEPMIDFVKEIIVPFSRQFKNLHLVLRPPQVRDLLTLPSGSLDGLEQFHIALHVGLSPLSILPAWKPTISAFSANSKLRGFRVYLTPYVVPRIFHLPWHTLQTFRCDSTIQLEDCHQLLLSCQALKRIHVRVFGIRFAGVPRFQIPLPNLINLTVQLCDQEAYDLFFHPLLLPALRSLVIYQYSGVPWSPSMYTSLLERSGCQIEHLYLGTLDADSEAINLLLEQSPQLKSLTISHNTEIEDVLQRIGENEIGSSLEQLFLKGTRRLDPILTMLETRQHAMVDSVLSPLTFVETHCPEEEKLAAAPRIYALQNQGVIVSVVQTPEEHFQL